MKVVFDGCCLGDGPVTGVARSFLNALAAYAARGDAECTLLVPLGAHPPTIDRVDVVDAPRGALRRQLWLPRLLRTMHADLLHSSVAAVPLRAPCPTIATVHDVPWLHAEAQEPGTWWRRWATARALRAAAAVLAPSQFTFDDAVSIVRDRSRLLLVPHGTERVRLPPPVDARTGPWLVLGDDRPRKNHDAVRAAHALAQQQGGERSVLPALQFVGPPHAYVDEAEKARLLRTCSAVVQMSRFEGFGMPVLEAMAHGAPVLCADIPPFRELAGDAALFADPTSITAIAAAMQQLADPRLRQQLADRGYQRAAPFSPAAVAAHWHAVHRSLVA